MEPHAELQIVTLEEFAGKLRVSEKTVWKWIKHGKLKPGRHFIQIDRVIRFQWCAELLRKLHEDCCTAPDIEPEFGAAEQTARKKNAGCPLNLSY